MPHISPLTRAFLSLLLTILAASFPARAGADGAAHIPSLEDFVGAVSNGHAEELRGMYVPGLLASWVVPQPEGDRGFVSSEENTLTRFGLADRFGSTGLLAHNTLAGRNFTVLKAGQAFTLVYGDGRTESFVVSRILRFWALDPENNRGMFFDLNKGGFLSAPELVLEVYDQPGHVVLQTCIDALTDPSWGRMFVIAEPKE